MMYFQCLCTNCNLFSIKSLKWIEAAWTNLVMLYLIGWAQGARKLHRQAKENRAPRGNWEQHREFSTCRLGTYVFANTEENKLKNRGKTSETPAEDTCFVSSELFKPKGQSGERTEDADLLLTWAAGIQAGAPACGGTWLCSRGSALHQEHGSVTGRHVFMHSVNSRAA